MCLSEVGQLYGPESISSAEELVNASVLHAASFIFAPRFAPGLAASGRLIGSYLDILATN